MNFDLVLSFGLLCFYSEVSMRCCREINAHTNHNLVYNVKQRVEIQRKYHVDVMNEESNYFHFF